MAYGRQREANRKVTAKEIAQSITDYRLLGRNKNRREGNTLSDAAKAKNTLFVNPRSKGRKLKK